MYGLCKSGGCVMDRRTKKKKIHVVTTLKRPVPLRHYLYTGHNKQTCNELFEIVLNTEINQRRYDA